MIVVLCAAVAAWWIWPEGSAPVAEDGDGTAGRRIREVKSAVSRIVPEKSARRHPVPDGSHAKDSGGTGASKTPASVEGKGTEVQVERLPPPVFTNHCDQLLALVLGQDPDAEMPPLPEMDEVVDADFVKSLNQPIVISDDDDEVVRELKRKVLDARKEIDEALSGSAHLTVGKILNEYREKFNDNLHLRTDAQVAIRQFLDEGDVESANAYAEKVNEVFQKIGIAEVKVEEPKRKRRRMK